MKYDRETVRSTLLEATWFKDLPEEAIEQLCSRAYVKTYAPNQYLYLIGEALGFVYCVMAGRVRMSVTSSIGQEFVLTDLHPYAWFGESSLVDQETNVQEAWVQEESDVLMIPSSVVVKVADKFPVLYRNLFLNHVKRTRGVYDLLTGMLFYPLKSRLAGRLLHLVKKHGEESGNGIELDMHMSQIDFARMSMGSRQRVNKIFRDWVKQGIMEKDGDKYVIKDVMALRREIDLEDDD
jgi:CRP-like cAMP-binding protein